MKLEEAVKQDFTKMTPQQKSHLRKRLAAAGMPIPPGLESRHESGNDAPIPVTPSKDNESYTCTVVDAQGTVTNFRIDPHP